jgi:hypothetical protein
LRRFIDNGPVRAAGRSECQSSRSCAPLSASDNVCFNFVRPLSAVPNARFGSIAQSNDCFQRAMCRFAVIVDPDALVLREQSSVAVLQTFLRLNLALRRA